MKKREKHFLLPMQKMRVKTQNDGPHLLVWRVGGIHMVKDMNLGD
jgi:hypothetical protein